MTGIRNIGLLTPGWPGHNTANGIATAVYNLALGLRETGITPVILAQRIDGDADLPDIPVVEVPHLAPRFTDRLGMKLGLSNAVHRSLARNITAAIEEASGRYGLDAVILEETNGWAGMIRHAVPVFVTLHGPWVLHKSLQSTESARRDRERERREARACIAAKGLMSPSRSVLSAMEGAIDLSGVPRTVIANAIAPLAPHPAAPGPEILFIGRFDRHKGGDTMIEAFATAAARETSARLTFCGPDRGVQRPGRPVLHIEEALAGLESGVRERIDFRGPVSRAEVAGLRARHGIAVIASRYENLNYTLLEAMAAGQAILCTDVGGPAEILEHERTALLVPPDDPAAMAEALCRLVGDADLRGRLGRAVHAKLREDFDPATIARQTVDFIEATLATRSR